jgi:hypothetical protein
MNQCEHQKHKKGAIGQDRITILGLFRIVSIRLSLMIELKDIYITILGLLWLVSNRLSLMIELKNIYYHFRIVLAC